VNTELVFSSTSPGRDVDSSSWMRLTIYVVSAFCIGLFIEPEDAP
jgi:hypothetical protein